MDVKTQEHRQRSWGVLVSQDLTKSVSRNGRSRTPQVDFVKPKSRFSAQNASSIKRLAVGLRPNPLGLIALPQTLAGFKGWGPEG